MKILIDTNILLDFYCQREDFYHNAANIFDLSYLGKIELWVSPISFVNFFYITRKEYTLEERYDIMRGLLQLCHIACANHQVLSDALSSIIPDFEDMVQYHSARYVAADYIITRNVKDFISTTIPVLTPSEFLAKF